MSSLLKIKTKLGPFLENFVTSHYITELGIPTQLTFYCIY